MDLVNSEQISPVGRTAKEGASRRSQRDPGYTEARAEYVAIRELRKTNWIAAHIRERRYELDLTQEELAERAKTSHSYISKLESGRHKPTLEVLKRIVAALDETLLIGIERHDPGEAPEREIARVPEFA